jgi:hypothetical protein
MVWSECPTSMGDLAAAFNVNSKTISAACARLVQRGWLAFSQHRRFKQPVPLIPASVQELMVVRLRDEFDAAMYRGEFLMRAYLDMRICSDDYVDNARLDFLTNPATGQRLEYDRYYRLGVGFEFNGPQHYKHTRKFMDDEGLRQRQTRDLIKKGLSLDAHVALVTVTADQLHPTILETLIPDTLPRRPIDTNCPYCRALAELSVTYAAQVRSWTA